MNITITYLHINLCLFQTKSLKTGREFKKPKKLKEPHFTVDVKLSVDKELSLGADYLCDTMDWYRCVSVDKIAGTSCLINHQFTFKKESFHSPKKFL